jgi:L-serine dehydratase
MKDISIFDVIGPNMIGPSSSHTAGALRIALMARKIVADEVKEVTFRLYGSFAKTYEGHGTNRALVGGILGYQPDDVRIKDSFDYAKERHVEFHFDLVHGENPYHPNTVECFIESVHGEKTFIRGESIGGGEMVIKNINGVEIDLTGEYDTILVKQKDEPGVVAYLSNCLARFDVNIAFMKLYREDKGSIAYTIIEMDDPICEKALGEIEADASIMSAVYIPR